MSLRRVTPDEVEAAARLHLATALSAYAHIFPPEAPKPSAAEMEGRWSTIVTEGVGWMVDNEGLAVGVAGLRPEEGGGRLEAVYVDPASWGMGIGSRLVEAAEREAVARGWLPLRLWVLEKNDRTRSWYERRGWHRERGRRRTVWESIDDVGYILHMRD